MSCGELRLNSDNTLTLEGLFDDASEAYVNDATVQLTLVDSAETEFAGQSWPLAMAYVAGSDGDYRGVIEDSVVAQEGESATAQITAVSGTLNLELELPFVWIVADQDALLWTSRDELEDMFGVSNVQQWADLDNDRNASKIAARVRWAAQSMTDDVKLDLIGSPVKVDEIICAPTSLRLAVTRLAGVLLYESRGLKAADNEEGGHRLARHEKMARTFLRRVKAGQVRIEAGVTDPCKQTPKFFTQEDDEDDATEFVAVV